MLEAALDKTPLQDFIPAGTYRVITTWLTEHHVSLKIKNPRATKLGDYRSPHNGYGHRITINNDLNEYAFLITMVHEMAHLATWEKHKNKVKPHGAEWKHEFRGLMLPFISENVFPDDIMRALTRYLGDPSASSCTDTNLWLVLRQYDAKQGVLLQDLPVDATFSLIGSRKRTRSFKKGAKLRKRFKCIDLDSNRCYLINGVAEVERLDAR